MSEEAEKAAEAEETARAYYGAIDAGDYERFADLLASSVVHDRPDRTIEGRETLVGFMRDDRPKTDTSHEVEASFRNSDDESESVAVSGRLLDADGTELFAFVDVFEVERDGIARIRTYTG